jgi:hypothetical protein
MIPQPMSAAALMAMRFEQPRWAVPGLIPEGLFLIAARPKMGKSWLMLNVSVAVAAGGRALGSVPVEPGDVLYLALEDTPRRLQGRLVTMLEVAEEAPERLALMTEWPRLDDGGLTAIGAWLEAHPNARLVVIDTLAKVRARTKRRDSNAYEDDYEALAGLKRLADKYEVAIGVVHHQRKLAATDPLDTISGTLGLSAGPDTILILTRSRGEADAVLHVTGRDVEEARHAMRWEASIGTWSLLGLPSADLSSERAAVLRLLMDSPSAVRPAEAAEQLGESKGATRKLMWSMAGDGQLSGDGVGGYYLPVRVTGHSGNAGNTGNGSNGHV